MSLNQFFQDVGVELQELFWCDVPRPALGDEIKHLEGRVRQESASLARQLSVIDGLRTRVAERERRQRWLASRIEMYHNLSDPSNAWQNALELDHVRARLEQERSQLNRQRRTFQQQQASLEQLERRLAKLLAQG